MIIKIYKSNKYQRNNRSFAVKNTIIAPLLYYHFQQGANNRLPWLAK